MLVCNVYHFVYFVVSVYLSAVRLFTKLMHVYSSNKFHFKVTTFRQNAHIWSHIVLHDITTSFTVNNKQINKQFIIIYVHYAA